MSEIEQRRNNRGRPRGSTLIDEVVVNDRGDETTTGELIVALVRRDGYLEPACAAAGAATKTVYDWMRSGARAQIRAHGGETIDPADQTYLDFLHAVDQARELWLHDHLTLHAQVAAGGIIQETITVEILDGKETKRTTRTTATLPDARALEWRMKHRNPEMFADRVEVTGAAGGPVVLSTEDRAAALVETAKAAQARHDGSAVPRAHRARKPKMPAS